MAEVNVGERTGSQTTKEFPRRHRIVCLFAGKIYLNFTGFVN